MASAATAIGVSKAQLQLAKKSGCKAFDSHSRVNSQELLRFLLAGDDTEENANWPDRLKRAQALMAEMELERTKGELVERAQVRADMTKASARAIAVLTQKFETELPPKQDGMPAADIATMNRAALHEARLILSQPDAYAE